MKLKRKELFDAINRIIPIINKKSPMQVITNILIEFSNYKLRLFGTNIEIIICCEIEIQEDINEKNILINGHVLFDVLKKINSEFIEIEIKEESLIIFDEKGKFVLNRSYQTFPMREIPVIEEYTIIKSKTLIDLIDSIYFSGDESNAKIVFKPDKLELVVHDRRRFSFGYIKGNFEKNIRLNLSIKSFLLFKKLIVDENVLITINNKEIILKQSNFIVLFKTIDLPDFNYESFLDFSIYNKWNCLTKDLLESIQRVLSVSQSSTQPIKLKFQNNFLEITSFDPNIGSSSDRVCGQGEVDLLITLNGDYIIESLNCLKKNEKINIFVQNSNKPFLLENNGIFHLIMPIR